MLVKTTATPISRTFDKCVMPYIFDIGKIIFKCSVVYGAYYLMRKKQSEGLDRMKWAVIGYLALKFTDVFINLTEDVSTSMLKNSK